MSRLSQTITNLEARLGVRLLTALVRRCRRGQPALVERIGAIAAEKGVTPAQVALAPSRRQPKRAFTLLVDALRFRGPMSTRAEKRKSGDR